MERSQNGWTASPTRSAIGVQAFSVAGVDFPGGVRRGDVAWILTWALTRWNREVEKLASPGCWGWSYRPNKNDPSSLSNHASGTAVDVNAPKHPNGKRGTYTTAQRAAIKRILADCHNVLRSGEFYSSTVDGMHLEVNVSPVALAAEVKRLKARQPFRYTRLPLRFGDRSVDVKHMQQRLIALRFLAARDTSGRSNADEVFGRTTLAALKAWEKATGRPVNGVFDLADARVLQ